jgi:hypothetical protein
MRIEGAHDGATLRPAEPLPGAVNLLLGDDPSRWRRHLPRFARVETVDVLDGVDFLWHARRDGDLEWSARFEAGVDVATLALAFDADATLQTESTGAMTLRRGDATLRMGRPRAFETGDGPARELPCRYEIATRGGIATLGVRVEGRNPARALLVDPTLEFSSRLGGSYNDFGHGVDVGADEHPVFIGWTSSLDFPVVAEMQGPSGGGIFQSDVFVSKLDARTGDLIYSTYIGGLLSDFGFDVDIAPDGSLALTGTIVSRDFPVVNPVQPQHGGDLADAWVARLEPDGSALRWSTYCGGNLDDQGHAVAVAPDGATVMVGWSASSDLPVVNPLRAEGPDGLSDGLLVGYAPDGASLRYLTYLGGSIDDQIRGVAVAADGDVWMCGWSSSPDFPLADAQDDVIDGVSESWLMRLSANGGTVEYATFFGGDGFDEALTLALGPDGSPWVAGWTTSADFPLQETSHQTVPGGGADAFVARFDAGGSGLVASTLLGGTGVDEARGIAIDGTGAACVVGATADGVLPTRREVAAPGDDTLDSFAARFTPALDRPSFVTTLGGDQADQAWAVAVDSRGTLWVCGQTFSTTLPEVRPFPTADRGAAGTSEAHFFSLGARACGAEVRKGSLRAAGDGTAAQLTMRGVVDPALLAENGDTSIVLVLRSADEVLRIPFPAVEDEEAPTRIRREVLPESGGHILLRLNAAKGTWSIHGSGLALAATPGPLLEVRIETGDDGGSDIARWREGPQTRRGKVDLRLR